MARERIYSSGEFIGPYEVTRTMATGGMGIVYEARPCAERRGDLLRMGIDRVAVKVARLGALELERHERKVLMARIDREFQTLLGLTKLDHPNVVSVFDWGWEDSVPYYVMEVVDGVTLGEALAERPRVGQAIHLFAQLCGAVAFLHHGGICHRDLKPSNVMVRASDGSPVLIDFGICLPPTERTLTGPGELLGTPAYLSPEYAAHWLNPDQTRPYVAAPTDDVWALGVMLYELLTGELPWRTPPGQRERLLREILTVRPPHPSDVYSRAPRALGDVAMQMLEVNLALRPRACSRVVSLLGKAGQESDVLSPLPPRRSGSRGLTSDATPTEHVPERRAEPLLLEEEAKRQKEGLQREETTRRSEGSVQARRRVFATLAASVVLSVLCSIAVQVGSSGRDQSKHQENKGLVSTRDAQTGVAGANRRPLSGGSRGIQWPVLGVNSCFSRVGQIGRLRYPWPSTSPRTVGAVRTSRPTFHAAHPGGGTTPLIRSNLREGLRLVLGCGFHRTLWSREGGSWPPQVERGDRIPRCPAIERIEIPRFQKIVSRPPGWRWRYSSRGPAAGLQEFLAALLRRPVGLLRRGGVVFLGGAGLLAFVRDFPTGASCSMGLPEAVAGSAVVFPALAITVARTRLQSSATGRSRQESRSPGTIA